MVFAVDSLIRNGWAYPLQSQRTGRTAQRGFIEDRWKSAVTICNVKASDNKTDGNTEPPEGLDVYYESGSNQIFST